MDPSTFALMVKALAEMITEIVKGQPPAEKAKMWEWFVKDVEFWRKLFRVDHGDAK